VEHGRLPARDRPGAGTFRHVFLKLALAVALLLPLAVPAGASAVVPSSPRADLVPGQGALTAGDPHLPTLGNGGYRVLHYDLRLRYAPATRVMQGRAIIAATTTQALGAFSLDFDGMTVESVLVDGVPVAFRRERTKLVVTPSAPLAAGQGFSVTVAYAGVPGLGEDGFGATGWVANAHGAVAYCEPDGAQRWFPNDSATTDKARYDISITVPTGFTAISNGRLLGRTTDRAQGTTTWRWRERSPMVAYAATVAIGRFTLTRTRTSDGIDLWTAVQQQLPRAVKDAARRDFAELPAVLRFFRTRFGPYPFETSGGIVGDFGFVAPLETQSRPIYDGPHLLQAHEIAHQWFGNSLTLTRWSDLWLHEGFATFAEWLWDERTDRAMDEKFASTLRLTDWTHSPPTAAPGKNLFNAVTYQRGAATLQGLRMLMGDARFFALLREWVRTHRDGNVTTEEFVALARVRGGVEAERFLRRWLYGRERPALPAKIVKRLDALR